MKANVSPTTLTLVDDDGSVSDPLVVSHTRNLNGPLEVTFLVAEKPVVAEVNIDGVISGRRIEDSAAMLAVFGDKAY